MDIWVTLDNRLVAKVTIGCWLGVKVTTNSRLVAKVPALLLK